MGGQCLRGDNGWEVGVYGNEMTKEGRYWWTGDVEGQGGGNKVVGHRSNDGNRLIAAAIVFATDGEPRTSSDPF